jgi:hypothetical protein
MDAILGFLGTYHGAGTWHDEVGKSGTYTVAHAARQTTNGFDVEFRHDFDDATVVEAGFSMTWLEAGLFRVEIAGAAAGNGYVSGELCHYHIATDRVFVEVSYRANGDALEVYGSSTRNAEGRYVAWRESLRRK